jgi:D-cysteine desulfhydrase/L-cysteate sulfo-lyase
MITPSDLLDRLDAIDRVPLSHLPTPLEEMKAISQRLPGVTLHMKRDDQTGLAFGGNKARKLEHIMADVLANGADSVVTWAGVQSNWCRQVAAACARCGIRPILVLLKKPGLPLGEDGNLLLDRLFNAQIHVVDAPAGKSFLELENVREFLEPVMEAEQAAGRKPYLAPVGGSLLEGHMRRPLGALGYSRAFAEIIQQSFDQGFVPDSVLLASGSAGTQAGLLAGAKLLPTGTRIVGISVAGTTEDVSGYVEDIANATLRELGSTETVQEDEVLVLDDYLADGYGVLNQQVTEAVHFVAREEGILLDPVYTGKSMAALLDLREKGFFKEGERVVFLHTGGTPAIFPYREGLLRGL